MQEKEVDPGGKRPRAEDAQTARSTPAVLDRFEHVVVGGSGLSQENVPEAAKNPPEQLIIVFMKTKQFEKTRFHVPTPPKFWGAQNWPVLHREKQHMPVRRYAGPLEPCLKC
jgi:hypothetical protein